MISHFLWQPNPTAAPLIESGDSLRLMLNDTTLMETSIPHEKAELRAFSIAYEPVQDVEKEVFVLEDKWKEFAVRQFISSWDTDTDPLAIFDMLDDDMWSLNAGLIALWLNEHHVLPWEPFEVYAWETIGGNIVDTARNAQRTAGPMSDEEYYETL